MVKTRTLRPKPCRRDIGQQSPHALARRIAADLMTAGNDKVAQHLRLISEDGKDLGGWGFIPLVNHLERILRDEGVEMVRKDGPQER